MPSPFISQQQSPIHNSTEAHVLAIIEQLKRNESIHRLDIRYAGISENTVISLAQALKCNTTLYSLNLSHNRLSLRSCTAIAQMLEHNAVLHHLEITSCRIDEAGLLVIATALQKNSALAYLDIRGNQITIAAENAMIQACQTNQTILTLRGVYSPTLRTTLAANKANALAVIDLLTSSSEEDPRDLPLSFFNRLPAALRIIDAMEEGKKKDDLLQRCYRVVISHRETSKNPNHKPQSAQDPGRTPICSEILAILQLYCLEQTKEIQDHITAKATKILEGKFPKGGINALGNPHTIGKIITRAIALAQNDTKELEKLGSHLHRMGFETSKNPHDSMDFYRRSDEAVCFTSNNTHLLDGYSQAQPRVHSTKFSYAELGTLPFLKGQGTWV